MLHRHYIDVLLTCLHTLKFYGAKQYLEKQGGFA